MNESELAGAPPSVTSIIRSMPQILEYLPLLGILQAAGSASTVDARAAALILLLKFAAVRTSTPLDDDFLAVLEPCLKTKEGMALVTWIANKAAAMVEGERIMREMAEAR